MGSQHTSTGLAADCLGHCHCPRLSTCPVTRSLPPGQDVSYTSNAVGSHLCDLQSTAPLWLLAPDPAASVQTPLQFDARPPAGRQHAGLQRLQASSALVDRTVTAGCRSDSASRKAWASAAKAPYRTAHSSACLGIRYPLVGPWVPFLVNMTLAQKGILQSGGGRHH